MEIKCSECDQTTEAGLRLLTRLKERMRCTVNRMSFLHGIYLLHLTTNLKFNRDSNSEITLHMKHHGYII